jgi:hypothetical protein
MKAYLPPATHPWRRKIERQHLPIEGSYSSFRPCVRWEFGFSCAFCLLHEADVMLSGAEGWGLILRGKRRYWMERCADRLVGLAKLESRLLDQVVEWADGRPLDELLDRLELARELRAIRDVFYVKLAAYQALPDDRDSSCRCKHTDHCHLPSVLSEQTVNLGDLLEQANERLAHQNVS